MNILSSLILPFLVLIVIVYGIYKHVDIYDAFIEGAKESFPMILTMFPCMLAMVFGVNLFLSSGFLEDILSFTKPVLEMFHIPVQILTLAFLKPISGGSSLAILNSIFETFGVDSIVGKMASIIQGSTDTTIYILTLYFGSVGIKKIRYSLFAGLIADLAGIISAIVIANFFF